MDKKNVQKPDSTKHFWENSTRLKKTAIVIHNVKICRYLFGIIHGNCVVLVHRHSIDHCDGGIHESARTNNHLTLVWIEYSIIRIYIFLHIIVRVDLANRRCRW